ncbi:alpha-amylase family protein [Luteococcus peritonei]|uniref:Alpha-amylase n=1 Tax=Luteococcus peritonei TaxID=88874 RepID=A0ABW4RV25_9ACTN
MSQTADLWWKNGVFYCAPVQAFLDTDGDGTGDLPGMTRRIDYLADLGVTVLWLMPFYPSGGVDDGYDVTDFYGVDPRYGNLGDFVELVQTAQSRGIRVIIDFVMNHTSDQHPWFKESRKSVDNPYRDHYVWRSSTPPDTSEAVVFPDVEDSLWELDERTGEYYLHNFYRQQPDLNVANPVVREEITKVMGFWLQLGVSGFRVDAVPFMFSRDDLPAEESRFQYDPHEALRHLRSFCQRKGADIVLLGEVNVPFAEQKKFFGGSDGDELTMQFDFIGMQAFWLSLARQDARPLAKALRRRPETDVVSQYANFVRNHDELTLDKLTESERQEVFQAFGPDPDMQIYERGLRRRLPTMLQGDPRRIKMAYSLMFSLPGTPTLFYGEEIGMGENLDVEGRYAVRTPMQWNDEPLGGFSTARPSRLVRPLPGGGYGPEHVNVASQRRDPDSLWRFIRKLVRVRRQSPEVGFGDYTELRCSDNHVLAHAVQVDDWSLVAVHNFSPEATTVRLDLEPTASGRPAILSLVDLLSDRCIVADVDVLDLEVAGYDHHWFRVHREGDDRIG